MCRVEGKTSPVRSDHHVLMESYNMIRASIPSANCSDVMLSRLSLCHTTVHDVDPLVDGCEKPAEYKIDGGQYYYYYYYYSMQPFDATDLW